MRVMSTKVQMDVEEYLRTSFDGSDCEYLDGEIVERNMGELPHGDVQVNLAVLLRQLRRQLGIRVVTEIRIQIHSRRYRVADIAVWRDDNIGGNIPAVPPFLAGGCCAGRTPGPGDDDNRTRSGADSLGYAR
jgi:Uma2 family endonuclease